MAASTIAGASGGEGRNAASAVSTSARRASRYAPSPSAVFTPCPSREHSRRCRPDLAAFVEDLDALLGLFESCVTEAREVDAALVELQRRFEGEVAFFEFLDDSLELGDRSLEIFDGGIHLVLSLRSSVFGLRSSVYLRILARRTRPSDRRTGPAHRRPVAPSDRLDLLVLDLTG